MSKESTYVGAHGESLRRRALEHPDSPLARDLVMAASWIDALNQRIQNQSDSTALPDLIEAAKQVSLRLDAIENWLSAHGKSAQDHDDVTFEIGLLRALRSALSKGGLRDG